MTSMAGRLTQQELRDEVHAMCRRGGINPADVTVVFPAALEAEHCRNLRRYAQVDLDATRFEFATSVLELPDVYREAVIAHEVGHVVAEREWGKSSEKDADVAAAEFLGVEIDYDKAWPGKGLQMKTNPTRDDKAAYEAFADAMRDPDPSSTEVAQDILLENGLKLADVSNRIAEELDVHLEGYVPEALEPMHLGTFEIDWKNPTGQLEPRHRVTWCVLKKAQPVFYVIYQVTYDSKMHSETVRIASTAETRGDGVLVRLQEAVKIAAQSAWATFAIMKEAAWEGLTWMQFDQRVKVFGTERANAQPKEINPPRSHAQALDAFTKAMVDPHPGSIDVAQDSAELAERIDELKKTYRPLSAALKGNPMPKKNPDDLERARDKYEEFHRYAPKKEIFERSFKIPTRMRKAGKSKWVTYRSGKVDPSSLKKPKHPVDYIHEHDAGVHTYLPDDPDTDVPSSYRQVDALVKLGENLGFCFVDHDGETIEAEGQGKLPELYTTPDGKCLLVIQDRKKVLAMIWGGGLGVFARGIDG